MFSPWSGQGGLDNPRRRSIDMIETLFIIAAILAFVALVGALADAHARREEREIERRRVRRNISYYTMKS
jgi:hypothetical protein